MDRRKFLQSAALTGSYALAAKASPLPTLDGEPGPLPLVIHSNTIKGDFHHVWEACVGSDRAAVAFRQQWLSDLERAKKELGMRSVRFHGLFDDEMGVWPVGSKTPNFLYVDIVIDSLIERGLKPFVELSFMPGNLASGSRTAFFYRGNITTPKEMPQWGELIRAFAQHCIDRYGLAEVSTWNFEVWNEANLPFFWSGKQADYFELYKESATALKSVNKGLKVGGPSTARAAWVGDLLEYCAANQVPIDFVSTHVYPEDPQNVLFGENQPYPFEEVMPRALQKVREEINSSKNTGFTSLSNGVEFSKFGLHRSHPEGVQRTCGRHVLLDVRQCIRRTRRSEKLHELWLRPAWTAGDPAPLVQHVRTAPQTGRPRARQQRRPSFGYCATCWFDRSARLESHSPGSRSPLRER